jgi:large-conductance mechanosensitive channel
MNPVLQAATTAATVKAVTSEREPRPVERKENPKTLQEAFLARPLTWLIVGGVAAYFVVKVATKVSDDIKARRDEKKQKQQLEDQEKKLRREGQIPSFNEYQYTVYADALAEALTGATEDEEDFLPVMRMMKNDLDVTKLIQAFGTRDLSSSWNPIKAEHTLPTAVAAYFSTKELEEYINAPLRRNGVKFQFSI